MSSIALLFRLVVSLGVVFGLMALAAKGARRVGLGGASSAGGRRRGAPIEVVARHQIGRRASVALVRAGGRGLVLGVTDQSVTLLAETDSEELLPIEIIPEAQSGTTAAATPWTALLDRARERTARRS